MATRAETAKMQIAERLRQQVELAGSVRTYAQRAKLRSASYLSLLLKYPQEMKDDFIKDLSSQPGFEACYAGYLLACAEDAGWQPGAGLAVEKESLLTLLAQLRAAVAALEELSR